MPVSSVPGFQSVAYQAPVAFGANPSKAAASQAPAKSPQFGCGMGCCEILTGTALIGTAAVYYREPLKKAWDQVVTWYQNAKETVQQWFDKLKGGSTPPADSDTPPDA